MALLKHFKWKKFSVIFEDHESSTDLLKSIKQAIEVENQNSGKNEGYTIMNTSLIKHFSEVSVAASDSYLLISFKAIKHHGIDSIVKVQTMPHIALYHTCARGVGQKFFCEPHPRCEPPNQMRTPFFFVSSLALSLFLYQ